jgi:hypothetical protein
VHVHTGAKNVRSETKVMKIENGLDANELDQSVHMRTRAENIRSQDLV